MAETVAAPVKKAKSKTIAYVNPDLCTGCEACLSVMPHDDCILKQDAPAAVPFSMVVVKVENEKCTGCTLCMRICPWDAISMVPRPS